MGAVSAPFRGLRSLRETLDQHWDVHRENEELRARLAEMEAWRQLALSLRGTVSAYEAILDVPAVETLDPVVAMTVAESGGPFQHARLMDVGEEHGVSAGYPVLTDRGLIGRVISVSRRSSRILLLTDANSKVPVMTEDGAVHGILIGDNTNLPRLDFGRGGRPLEAGERIVTSGEADVFPRNLPVGLAALAGDDVWRVRLYSGGEPADLAWIYPHQPITPPPPEAVTPVFRAPPDPAPEAGPGETPAEGPAADTAAAPPAEPAPEAGAETAGGADAVQQANATTGDPPE